MSIDYFKVNGVTVANIENQSDIVLFGFAMLAGSNYETREVAGIAHFAEHLFFKGTKTRNWQQINHEFARLGVNNNAYTSNNEVFYHTTCPKDNLSSVIEIMMDMLFNSTIPEDELEKERGVIIEEKKMNADNPNVAYGDALGDNIFPWEIGHQTLGSFDTIASIQKSDILKYLDDKVNLENMIFICSGNIESEDLKKYLSKYMPSQHSFLKNGSKNTVLTDAFWNDKIITPTNTNKMKYTFERDNITQTKVDMMIRGLSVNDTMYYDMVVLCKALGGGMYSLLFEKIREELGLCYSIGMNSFIMNSPNGVGISLYGGVSSENLPLFIESSEEILHSVKDNGIDKEFFECAKISLISAVLRQTETSFGKAMYMVQSCLINKKGDIEDRISAMERVTLDRVNGLASTLLDTEYNWTAMMPSNL